MDLQGKYPPVGNFWPQRMHHISIERRNDMVMAVAAGVDFAIVLAGLFQCCVVLDIILIFFLSQQNDVGKQFYLFSFNLCCPSK